MDFALALPPDAASPPGTEDHPPPSSSPPPSATPSSAASASASASANGEPAHRESKRLRGTTKPAYDPAQPAPPTFRLGDVGRQETLRRPTNESPPPHPTLPAASASTATRPPLPRLRTATSVPTSWLRPDYEVNGKRKAYFDGPPNSSRYTSLRELIVPTSPTPIATDPPAAADASSSASAADHYDIQSPRHSHTHQSISVHSIAIRNPLLKHAAYAYLLPTTPPAPEPKRSWLAPPRGHPDDDGHHSCDGYCADGAGAGGGLLCGGVGFVAGWVVGVVRCLFRRMFGRDAHAANKEFGFHHAANNNNNNESNNNNTNGAWEQQQQQQLEQEQQNHHQHQR